MNKKIVSIIVATIIFAGISYSRECETGRLKLQEVIGETVITPQNSRRYRRAEVIVINNRIFVAFNNGTPNKRFQLVELNEDLTGKSSIVDIFSDPTHVDGATDIRLAVAGKNLWYAFESVDSENKDNCDGHILNMAKYNVSGTEPEIINTRLDIARGCPQDQNLPCEIPENPEVVNDPTPIFHNGKYVILTRAWTGSVQHIRTFDNDFNLVEDFTLDLASTIGDRQLSQNALVNIAGQIYLIGGLGKGAPRNPNSTSDIYAIPLSNDLHSASGDKIPLITDPDKYYMKVTAARYHDGKLYINYVLAGDGQLQHLGVFDVANNFNSLAQIQFQDKSVTHNHSSIDVLGNRVYVFYQGNRDDGSSCILAKIFEWQQERVDYQDSPFGFHPGDANNYQYLQDLGATWSREGAYFVWDWVDVNRKGNLKFKDATAPPKPGVPNSGGAVNYDEQLMNIPDNVLIIKNINPFRKGGEFVNEAEKNQYYNFVKATVERYDGDDDCGCTESYPDCYHPGDNEYPDQKLIDRLKRNPVKYWQVCNQVFDACEIDCQNTYAQKFAEVQRLTYLAAKEADSTVQVLIAGDSHMEAYPDVFNELGGNYIDIIDLHRFVNERQYNPKEHLDYLKNSLINTGFELNNLTFWITETNTYSGDPVPRVAGLGYDLPYQNETQHARGLLKIHISDLAQGVKKVFWAWNIVEGFKRDGSIFDYGGLIYDGYEWTGVSSDDPNGVYSNNPADILYDKGVGVKKLAYYTYKLMTGKLEGSDWNNIEMIQEADNIYIYKFTKKNIDEPVYVAWWDYFNESAYSEGDTTTITLEVGNMDSVRITEAVPDARNGANLDEKDYPAFFITKTKQVVNNMVSITLRESPVFVELQSSTTSVNEETGSVTPEEFQLNQNYPNPFNPQTTISYQLAVNGDVTLKIYDMLGQEVRTLINENKPVGYHSVVWNGTDNSGRQVSSGVYFYQLQSGNNISQIKKLLLIK